MYPSVPGFDVLLGKGGCTQKCSVIRSWQVPQKTFSQLFFVPFHWLRQRRNERERPLQTTKQGSRGAVLLNQSLLLPILLQRTNEIILCTQGPFHELPSYTLGFGIQIYNSAIAIVLHESKPYISKGLQLAKLSEGRSMKTPRPTRYGSTAHQLCCCCDVAEMK